MHCSLGRSLEAVGDWWAPLIIRDISIGLNRFDQLAEDLGISRNLLATRLDDLIAKGIVERRQYSDRPARYEYGLTEAGVDLLPILMALVAWGDRWFTPPGGPPVRLVHTTCGHRCIAEVHCSACGERLNARDVIPRPGPGSVAGPGTALVPERLKRFRQGRRRQREGQRTG
jgi:DNA-binding HxlR family transcriptional regulator